MSKEKAIEDEAVEAASAIDGDSEGSIVDESASEALDQADAKEAEAQESLGELKSLLEDTQSKATEHWERVLRIQAELENVRRRATSDVEKAHKYALEGFAKDLLPVIDSLELGLSHTESSEDNEPLTKLKEGMELTLKMFAETLAKYGMTPVGEVGESFNPDLHQAMTMQEAPDAKPNTLLVVMQKGYLLNERLVRPALVVVSKG